MKKSYNKTIIAASLAMLMLSVNAQDTQKPAGKTFTENKGQLTDINNQPRPDIPFYGSAQGMRNYFMKDKICYVWSRIDTTDTPDTLYRMDMGFKHANPNPVISGQNKTEGVTNYFLAHTGTVGITNVPDYQKIIYKNLYAGIDLVLDYGAAALTYEFIVKAGANPEDIQFDIAAATAIDVDASKSLRLQTPLGEVNFSPLEVYKQIGGVQTPIVAQLYKTASSVVGVDIVGTLGGILAGTEIHLITTATAGAKCNGCVAVLAFPTAIRWDWSTYYGDVNDDAANDIKTDNGGNIYVTGNTQSPLFPTQAGLSPNSYNGTGDAFVIQFNNLRVRQWATFFGGTGNDASGKIALDASNNIYVAGRTSSTNIPTASPLQANQTGDDGFITELSNDGTTLMWSSYFGGNGGDGITGLAISPNGTICIAGQTTSNSGLPIQSVAGEYVESAINASGVAGFISKITPAHTLAWSTYLNVGNSSGYQLSAFQIATDKLNNLYITGNMQLYPVTSCTPVADKFSICSAGYNNTTYYSYGGSYPYSSIQGYNDMFIRRYSVTNTLTWSTLYGYSLAGSSYPVPNYSDAPHCITTDVFNNIYIGGYTDNVAFQTLNPGNGAYYDGSNASNNTNYQNNIGDAFILKFAPSTQLLWGTFYGGIYGESITGMACDNVGNVYATGNCSLGFPTQNLTGTYNQSANGGGVYDAFVLQFSAISRRVWSTYYGGDQNDYGTAIAANNTYIAIATTTNSNSFPVKDANPLSTADYYDNTFNGGSTNTFAGDAGLASFVFAPYVTPFKTGNTNNTNSGIAEVEAEATGTLTLMPNPANNVLTINWDIAEEKASNIAIYDITGAKVYETSATIDRHKNQQIDVSKFAKGLYIVRISTATDNVTKKIIVD